MKHLLLLLSTGAFFAVAALPAAAQPHREVAPSTVAPALPNHVAPQTPIVEVQRIEEGLNYGMHNRPGLDSDCYGSFDPRDDFTAACIEPYPSAAFAGTVVTTADGEGLLYYVDGNGSTQATPPDAQDSLGVYNFDTMEELPMERITYFDDAGSEIPQDSLFFIPQWVDGGLDTDTGNLILLGRARACTDSTGGQLWLVDLETREARKMLTFSDPDNCPLSGAYDNENNRFIGMVPSSDGPAAGFYQTDLTTGETVNMIPLPDDMFMNTTAPFIQGGATNYGDDDDPSNNEAWIFLFEGPQGGPNASSSRLITFDGTGVISGSENFGTIDFKVDWVEALATGFKSQPRGVANEGSTTPEAFRFIGVFPNPFQSSAAVVLHSDEPVEHVTVKVYDVLGREVAVLHDGPLAATQHQFGLQAKNLPAGVYFVSVRSGDFSQTKKVVLID